MAVFNFGNVYCILCIVHCILYIVYCILYIVHCILYIVYCTLYIVHCAQFVCRGYVYNFKNNLFLKQTLNKIYLSPTINQF